MIPCHSHPTALHGWIKNECNQIRYGESQGHIANGDFITIFYVWWSFLNIVHSLDRHLFWSSVSSYLFIDSEPISSSSEDHHWQSSVKISWLLLFQSDSIDRLCRPIPSYLLSGNMILEAALCRIVAYRRFSFCSSNIFLLIMSCSSGWFLMLYLVVQ